MFNRANKLTALLVAATSIIAMGTTASAATKLETKEGTISDAVVFNGKYIYHGYKGEDNDTDVYFSNGSKDTVIEDADDYTFNYDQKYGEKYITVTDNDDYLLDLSTGKIDDGETVEDKTDTASRNLKNAIKKADRYKKSDAVVTSIEEIKNDKYGKVWYSYESNGFKGFTDGSGNYIDVCNLANLYVTKADGSETVKLEEYDEENKGLTASLNKDSIKVLAQDDSYFYITVEVTVTGEGAPDGKLTYLQKVSKKQGETKDDAYLPKDVVSYEVSDKYDSSDADDAVAVITDASAKVVVNNGVLYAVQYTAGKDTEIKVTKFKLKKEKLAVDGQTNKLDVQVVEKDDDETHDITSGSKYVLDVDGNVWGVNKGKLFQMKGLTATDVYSCDSSLNQLSVYNDKNFMLWNDDDSYAAVINGSQSESTVSGGTTGGTGDGDTTGGTTTGTGDTTGTTTGGTTTNGATTGTTTNGTTTGTVTGGTSQVVKTGWVQNTDGTWSYINADGSKKTGWLQDGATWYYLKADGIMATGWLQDGSTWYYLKSSGAMATGWIQDGSTWYYLQSSGAMATGWLNDNGTWYYLNESGAMLANTTVGGYKLGASGAWIQ